MTLCEADITTKTQTNSKKTIVILKSSQKIVEVKNVIKFVIFNPITGEEIMVLLFNLKPSKEIECSKKPLKKLEGEILMNIKRLMTSC
jgi:hypothetical protein